MSTFIPMGGFPPLIRKSDLKNAGKALDTRNFQSTNIVSISNIMNKKKKKGFFPLPEETGMKHIKKEPQFLSDILFDEAEYARDK